MKMRKTLTMVVFLGVGFGYHYSAEAVPCRPPGYSIDFADSNCCERGKCPDLLACYNTHCLTSSRDRYTSEQCSAVREMMNEMGGACPPPSICGNGIIERGEICDPPGERSTCPEWGVCDVDCRKCDPLPPAPPVCSIGLDDGRRFELPGLAPGDPCCDKSCPVIIGCLASHGCDTTPSTPLCSAFAELRTALNCPVPPPPPPPAVCVPNGIKESPEQCDTFELPPELARTMLAEQCPAAEAGQELVNCNMRNCSCSYRILRCVENPSSECRSHDECEIGERCSVSCQCIPGEGSPPTPPPAPPSPPPPSPSATIENDCYSQALSFSSDAMRDRIRELNATYIAAPSGRNDYEAFIENEQSIRVICILGRGQSNQAAQSVAPFAPPASTPSRYALVQTGGTVFLNFTNPQQMPFKRIEPVQRPIRIFPIVAANQPSVSFGSSISDALSGTVPMTDLVADMPLTVTDGRNVVNGMIEYQSADLAPNQTFSISATGNIVRAISISVPPDTAATVAETAARTAHVFTFIAPAYCGTFTGVEGYSGCPNIEDQRIDFDALKAAIASRVSSGERLSSNIFYELPCEPTRNFTFKLLNGQTEFKFAFMTVDNSVMGEGSGGCKGCNVNGAVPDFASAFAAIVAMSFAGAGIVWGRLRKRR